MILRIFSVFALGAVLACSKTNVVNTTNNTFNNTAQVVGSMGARLESPGGAILDIPPGAVVVETELSVGEISPDAMGVPAIPGMRILQSPIFALEPHGQTFADDITITLPHMIADPNRIPEVWRADPGGTWQRLPTLATIAGRIQVTSRTFSYYVVLEYGSGDQDGDGYTGAADCDENDPQKNIAAEEICDGLDNNCNNQIDEGLLLQAGGIQAEIRGNWTLATSEGTQYWNISEFEVAISTDGVGQNTLRVLDVVPASRVFANVDRNEDFCVVYWTEPNMDSMYICMVSVGGYVENVCALPELYRQGDSLEGIDDSNPAMGGCGDSPWVQMTRN